MTGVSSMLSSNSFIVNNSLNQVVGTNLINAASSGSSDWISGPPVDPVELARCKAIGAVSLPDADLRSLMPIPETTIRTLLEQKEICAHVLQSSHAPFSGPISSYSVPEIFLASCVVVMVGMLGLLCMSYVAVSLSKEAR